MFKVHAQRNYDTISNVILEILLLEDCCQIKVCDG